MSTEENKIFVSGFDRLLPQFGASLKSLYGTYN